MDKEKLKKKVERWIIKEYGNRCSAYSFCCPCCEIWIAFDRLFNNPMSGYSWMKELEEE